MTIRNPLDKDFTDYLASSNSDDCFYDGRDTGSAAERDRCVEILRGLRNTPEECNSDRNAVLNEAIEAIDGEGASDE